MMRKLMILALTGIAMQLNFARAQDKPVDFTSVEKIPEYPGGIAKFYDYLGKEIRYPEAAQKSKTQGKVFVSFIIEKNGALNDVIVTRSLSKETDAEAIRVIRKSPNWNPGLIKGKPVRVKYNINVNFNLNDNGQQKKALNSSPDKPTEFPGGPQKLYSYLAKNIKYPAIAVKNKMQGKVFVAFFVEKDGTITNAKVTRGITKELDAEALRVIKNSPRWNPAVQNGKVVKVQYTLPINFTLS
ncbi:energy transducer TonB [Pedobacter sp. BMA]|uniref:energy transducer TonB n=1 Tax=Pedobacter sp. BMA TaxID=1663685 RepID=UPI0009E299C4|nr:energy transducer TonB [Pedobacter sp. BMA]